MKYVSVAEMIAIEKEADASGHTYEKMMEHAGRGLAEVVAEVYAHLKESGRPVLGLVGSGNNGGDTLVAMTYLLNWGWQARAYIVRSRPADDPLIARFVGAGGSLTEITSDPDYEALEEQVDGCCLLLDGILGTGIRLPLRGEIPRVLARVGRLLAEGSEKPPVVAVDCPSGVDCDRGEAAPECLPADMTVTMAAIKQGLLKFPAYKLVGELRLVGIGLSPDLAAWLRVRRFVVDAPLVGKMLPARPLEAHKGTFGTAVIVAGSRNYTGAALLAGEAAYRAGAGLVTLAIPEVLHSALAGQFTEATWLPLPQQDGFIAAEAAGVLARDLERATALLVGPGFGLADTTQEFIARLLEHALPPLVFDADGLKLLGGIPDWVARTPAPAVLTPHPGEMSVLTGMPTREIQSARVAVAERYAREWGHVVVLKGAFTVVAAPDGQVGIIPVASPALARAGTGDVLAGLIAGLRAQGVAAFPAALAGAWIHAQAGLLAAHSLGGTAAVLAGDVLRATPRVLAQFETE